MNKRKITAITTSLPMATMLLSAAAGFTTVVVPSAVQTMGALDRQDVCGRTATNNAINAGACDNPGSQCLNFGNGGDGQCTTNTNGAGNYDCNCINN